MARRRKATGWGGWRPGAGRKPSPDSGAPHTPRPTVTGRYPCHASSELHTRLPSLRTRPRLLREFEDSLDAMDRPDFRLCYYAVQTDRVDWFVEAPSMDALANGMRSITIRFARTTNRALGRKGRVLVDRYRLSVLKTPDDVKAALERVRKDGGRLRALDPPRSALLRGAPVR